MVNVLSMKMDLRSCESVLLPSLLSINDERFAFGVVVFKGFRAGVVVVDFGLPKFRFGNESKLGYRVSLTVPW